MKESLKINSADRIDIFLITVDLSSVKFVFKAHWSDKLDFPIYLPQSIFSV
jgi:hypothetical protein